MTSYRDLLATARAEREEKNARQKEAKEKLEERNRIKREKEIEFEATICKSFTNTMEIFLSSISDEIKSIYEYDASITPGKPEISKIVFSLNLSREDIVYLKILFTLNITGDLSLETIINNNNPNSIALDKGKTEIKIQVELDLISNFDIEILSVEVLKILMYLSRINRI